MCETSWAEGGSVGILQEECVGQGEGGGGCTHQARALWRKEFRDFSLARMLVCSNGRSGNGEGVEGVEGGAPGWEVGRGYNEGQPAWVETVSSGDCIGTRGNDGRGG